MIAVWKWVWRSLGLLVTFSAAVMAAPAPASQPAVRERIVIDDALQGKTLGTLVGGTLTEQGYRPGVGGNHVLYRLERTLKQGCAQFEFKGMDPAKVPADADHGFFAMYEGRGLTEPVPYSEDFKQNFNRWNVHWRQNRAVIKAVISCPNPTSQRRAATRPVFADERDWCAEPNGKAFAFKPEQWHTMRIEWRDRHFRVLVDGQEVWSAGGTHEYAPLQPRIWLGCAPGYVSDGKVKYHCALDSMIYRNFRLVEWEAKSDPATTPAMLSNSGADELVRFAAPWTSPFHVDPLFPHQLVNAEQHHLFILNKTAWAYFGCKNPAGVVQRAKAQGVTVLRVALEGRPYFSDLGMELWPWGGTREKADWARFNETYWNEVERRIRLAGEHGIGLDITLYNELKPGHGRIAEQRPFWNQTLRRLGKYANVLTWEIFNEYLGDESFQDAVGQYFAENDSFHRPVCTSDGTTDDAAWPSKRWMGLAINHSCTSSTRNHGLRDWYLAVARNTRSHGKPAWCNESGREKRHRNDDPIHRRKQGWLWYAAGCYWTHHSWEGCEGIDDPNYRAPGQEFLKPMAEFWQSVLFWQLDPNHTAFTMDDAGLVFTALADVDRQLVLAYLCTETSGSRIAGRSAKLRLPAGEYQITFIRPADNQAIGKQSLACKGLHETPSVTLPDFADDLAVKVERAGKGDRVPIPATR